MKSINNLKDIDKPFKNAVVTLGNFDGVHLGHREIFRSVVKIAKALEGTSIVCTFQPHPLKMLAPDHAPRLINTPQERERLIEASCVDVLLTIPFNQELAQLTPEEFVREVLVAKIGVKHLVVGYDYAFGRGRSGSIAFLKEQGAHYGFKVDVFGAVQKENIVLSSTRVRQAILSGNVDGAVALLGRHFNLEGTVVHGDGRGQGLGFATANLETTKELLPRDGVYAAIVRYDCQNGDNESCQECLAVVNIGKKPTFGDHPLTIEAHLLDTQVDFYGDKLRVYFVKRLRDEQKFANKEALCATIASDIQQARNILAETRIVEFREYLTLNK